MLNADAGIKEGTQCLTVLGSDLTNVDASDHQLILEHMTPLLSLHPPIVSPVSDTGPWSRCCSMVTTALT